MKIRKIMAGFLAAACIAGFTACSSNSGVSGSSSVSESASVNDDADKESTSSDASAAEMVKNAPATGGNIGDVAIQSGDIVAEFNIDGYGTIKAKLFPDIAPVGVQNFIQLAQSGYYTGKNIHRVISDFMLQGGSENGDGTGGSAAYSGEGSSADSFGVEANSKARHFYGALCYANALGQNSTQFYIVNSKQAQDIGSIDTSRISDVAQQAKEAKEASTPGTAEYSYYEAMENQYTNLADWIANASDDVKAKYQDGGVYYLDGGYTVFGQVVEGFDVIDSISGAEVQENASGENSKPVKDILISSVSVYTAE